MQGTIQGRPFDKEKGKTIKLKQNIQSLQAPKDIWAPAPDTANRIIKPRRSTKEGVCKQNHRCKHCSKQLDIKAADETAFRQAVERAYPEEISKIHKVSSFLHPTIWLCA